MGNKKEIIRIIGAFHMVHLYKWRLKVAYTGGLTSKHWLSKF